MLTRAERVALQSQVAGMFCDRQLSKVEIVARLRISRFHVARLIERALADGVVRIEFRDVPPHDRVQAQRAEEAWDFDLCAVIAVGVDGAKASLPSRGSGHP